MAFQAVGSFTDPQGRTIYYDASGIQSLSPYAIATDEAQLAQAQQSFQSVGRFTDPQGRTVYYDANGQQSLSPNSMVTSGGGLFSGGAPVQAPAPSPTTVGPTTVGPTTVGPAPISNGFQATGNFTDPQGRTVYYNSRGEQSLAPNAVATDQNQAMDIRNQQAMLETAIQANRPNQYTPMGSSTWSKDPTT